MTTTPPQIDAVQPVQQRPSGIVLDGSIPEFETPYNDNTVPLDNWQRHYDLLLPLLPFEYRAIDAVSVVISLREFFDASPVTKHSFRISYLKEDMNNRAVFDEVPERWHYWDEIVQIAGSWHMDVNAESSGKRYVNPNYVHLTASPPTVTDTVARDAWLETFVEYAHLDTSAIAPLFGCDSDEMAGIIEQSSVNWIRRRLAACDRLGRTIEAIVAWTDYDYDDMAVALGRSRQFVDGIRPSGEIGYQYEYRPPADPSCTTWFQPSNKYFVWEKGGVQGDD